jgi:cytochrome c-type biogenesis protein CcmE
MDAVITELPKKRSLAVPWKLLVATSVIVASIAFLVVTAMGNTAVYYLTVSELQAAGTSIYDQPVRVAGQVVPGSIQRDPTTLLVHFSAYDHSGSVPVTYKGVLPDIFADNLEVVVEGKYGKDGVFTAGTLLAKCPSKFESA